MPHPPHPPQQSSASSKKPYTGGFVDFSTRSYSAEELTLRMVASLEPAKAETVVRDLYFEGGNVLACKAGRFSFGFKDGESLELSPNEVLVVYPGNVVTIRSLKAGGSLNYATVEGTKAAEFLNDFGFYDKLKFPADVQDETFRSILRTSESGMGKEEALSRIVDALKTFQQILRREYGAILNDAIRVIHGNLSEGIVGIKPVCDVLHVSRSYLNDLFVRSGLGTPAAFIRHQQLAVACRLLKTTSLPIVDVGKSVGIRSPVYFSSYIRRLTGHTPSELRAKGSL